jgi:hypothetical protein
MQNTHPFVLVILAICIGLFEAGLLTTFFQEQWFIFLAIGIHGGLVAGLTLQNCRLRTKVKELEELCDMPNAQIFLEVANANARLQKQIELLNYRTWKSNRGHFYPSRSQSFYEG